MAVNLRCPVHREPLLREGDALVGASHGERYPILDGIPVLIADRAERRKVAENDWSSPAPAGGSALDFYNRTDNHDGFCRAALDEVRSDMTRWLDQARAGGPVLEIGSGKGALQRFGGEYTACDYSFTALRAHVGAEHTR